MIEWFLGLFVCYLLGSVPSAYLVGRAVKGIDIRQHGSGNVGAANVFRVVGKKWGMVVLIADLVKGLSASAVVAPLFYKMGNPLSGEVFRFWLGFASIAGHNWTLFLRFKGGKGVATSAGVFLSLLPKAALCAFLVWIAVVLMLRYVSVASMTAAFSFPLWLWVFYRGHSDFRFFFFTTLTIAGLTVLMHRSNIKRLLQGKEPKVIGGK